MDQENRQKPRISLSLEDIQQIGDCCDEFITRIQDISELFSDAHFNLILAKQSLNHVGPSMYDQRMKASKKVSLDENMQFNLISYPTTTRSSKPPKDKSSIKESSLGETTGMRKRNITQKDFMESPLKIEEKIMEENQDELVDPSDGIKDPLHWYGILVPQTLRKSQKQFDQVITRLVHLANHKRKLIALIENLEK